MLPVRIEERIPMTLAVRISSNERVPAAETSFTENVSARGARVMTSHRWPLNAKVLFAPLPGGFVARARVAYCEAVRESDFAIGLEFLEPSGNWVVGLSAAPERTLQG
jgi:hypothetical protein